MLVVNNLHTKINNHEILNGLNLEFPPGQIHVLMGANGSGKSTLTRALMGAPDVTVTEGSAKLDDIDLLDLEPNQRSLAGLFVAYQYPIEVPGVNFANFLRLAYNAHKSDEDKLPVFKFRKLLKEKAEILNIDFDFLQKNLNEGMSGGERKKAEILQMAMLEPKYAILDETDSGLDIDALKSIFNGILKLKQLNPKLGILLITHYERIFTYIKPDKVHIIDTGRIVKTGGMELVETILAKGYKDF